MPDKHEVKMKNKKMSERVTITITHIPIEKGVANTFIIRQYKFDFSKSTKISTAELTKLGLRAKNQLIKKKHLKI